MAAEAAPLRNDLAEGPGGGRAIWLQTADALRIRLGLWPQQSGTATAGTTGGTTAKGTILLLPGRTEYIEKYGRTAADLTAQGWSVAVLDWRGQGLSDRILPDPMLGHVQRFADYQLDLDAAMAWLREAGAAAGFPAPFVMLAHSMGGLIGLRALHRPLGIRAAVFSAPMWGIRMPMWRRPSAAILSRLSLALPQDRGYAPTTSGKNYLLVAPFEGNLLTSDSEAWAYLHRHAMAEPLFGLGGPSLGWVRDAVRECRVLMASPAPDVPVRVGLGAEERIVLTAPILRRMAGWPQGQLDLYPGARHEILMEQPESRALFIRRALDLFEQSAVAE